jgi:hypothetical protein
MKWERLRELAKELPGVVDSTSYGTAAIKVGVKRCEPGALLHHRSLSQFVGGARAARGAHRR